MAASDDHDPVAQSAGLSCHLIKSAGPEHNSDGMIPADSGYEGERLCVRSRQRHRIPPPLHKQPNLNLRIASQRMFSARPPSQRGWSRPVARMQAQHIADLVPCSLGQVRRLEGLGLLVSKYAGHKFEC